MDKAQEQPAVLPEKPLEDLGRHGLWICHSGRPVIPNVSLEFFQENWRRVAWLVECALRDSDVYLGPPQLFFWVVTPSFVGRRIKFWTTIQIKGIASDGDYISFSSLCIPSDRVYPNKELTRYVQIASEGLLGAIARSRNIHV